MSRNALRYLAYGLGEPTDVINDGGLRPSGNKRPHIQINALDRPIMNWKSVEGGP